MPAPVNGSCNESHFHSDDQSVAYQPNGYLPTTYQQSCHSPVFSQSKASPFRLPCITAEQQTSTLPPYRFVPTPPPVDLNDYIPYQRAQQVGFNDVVDDINFFLRTTDAVLNTTIPNHSAPSPDDVVSVVDEAVVSEPVVDLIDRPSAENSESADQFFTEEMSFTDELYAPLDDEDYPHTPESASQLRERTPSPVNTINVDQIFTPTNTYDQSSVPFALVNPNNQAAPIIPTNLFTQPWADHPDFGTESLSDTPSLHQQSPQLSHYHYNVVDQDIVDTYTPYTDIDSLASLEPVNMNFLSSSTRDYFANVAQQPFDAAMNTSAPTANGSPPQYTPTPNQVLNNDPAQSAVRFVNPSLLTMSNS